MKWTRRQLFRLAAGVAIAPAMPRPGSALDYPTRPVRVIVGFAAGGSGDIIVRLMNEWLYVHLGQQFIIDNRPGAGTNIGTEAAVRSAPDGYTLLLTTAANAINTTLYDNLDFNFITDIAPVASLERFPLVMEVNPAFPAATVPDFIAYAKSNPGKVNYGSGGVGTIQNVAGELFKFMTGVDMIHVPYRGAAPALNDLLAGRLQVAFAPIESSIGYIRAGRLRALAVTGASRSEALRDVPTVGEFVPSYEAAGSVGIGAPRGTPTAIIDLLNRSFNDALADPTIRSRLMTLGGQPTPLTPAQYGEYIAAETEKWAKVIKFAGIKAE